MKMTKIIAGPDVEKRGHFCTVGRDVIEIELLYDPEPHFRV